MMDQFFLHILRSFDLSVDPSPEWSVVPITKTQGYSNTRIYRVESTLHDAVGISINDPNAASPSAQGKAALGVPQLWCLRSWPLAEPGAEQLNWINQQLLLASHNCPFVLAPIPSRHSPTAVVEMAGRYWQLEPWATGQNDFHAAPTRQRLASVMNGLARLHACWHSDVSVKLTENHIGVWDGRVKGSLGNSAGLRNRLAQMEQWRTSAIELFPRAKLALCRPTEFVSASTADWLLWIDQVEQYWTAEFENCFRRLRLWESVPLRLGPILADVWSDHLFFLDEQLSTMIDYGAMRMDNAAADLSRCLSSLCGADSATREYAINCYQAQRILTETEIAAIEVYDETSRLLGPFHWLRWLFIEQKVAPSERLLRRLQSLLWGQPF
ncbi:MAG: phosphotransferase [Planctomycetaceae bacterium]|nr:phosphotransferase [Planctomycetaceae bacterium]